MPKPINVELFHHDGRGPELQGVHWGSRGTKIDAIDYFNPDDAHTSENLKHVRFLASQVVEVTPEEVIGTDQLPTKLLGSNRAAMFDMGQSAWLLSFSQRHLEQCRHFKLLFYDELFDVICERVECRIGGFDATVE